MRLGPSIVLCVYAVLVVAGVSATAMLIPFLLAEAMAIILYTADMLHYIKGKHQ